MKRFVFSGLLILICLTIITACGNSKSSGNSTLTTNTTSTSTNSMAGKQTVTVTLVEYKITASITTFHVGVPYHFVVTNKGTIPHEFLIMPPMSDSMATANMNSTALVFLPILSPGQTQTIDYTFKKADAHLEMACHFTGRQASDSHYMKGMHLAIIVET